ncbi:hypothetical protein ACVI1L_004698 [Bradyrhizobium sp. USDA 4516]
MFVLKHLRDKASIFEAYVKATCLKDESARVLSLEGFFCKSGA